jgi:hypothetical protein
MRIGDRKKFFLPPIDPTTAGVGLAFWAMPVSAANGELTITCIMGSIWLWGVPGEKEEFGGLFDAFGVRFCSP